MSQPPQNPNRISIGLLIVYFVLTTPAAATQIIASLSQDDPARALLFLIAFLLLSVIATFVTGIGQKMMDHLVDHISSDLLLRLNPYRKHYLEHVAYRNRNFDVKGISAQGPHTLELERVFVNLSIAPRTIAESTKDPIAVPKELSQGMHSIWDFLKNPQLSNLVIIGPPGSGKTTLLRFIALSLCHRKSRQQEKLPSLLPVLLYLRDHVDAIVESSNVSLRELLIGTLKDINVPPEGWFKKQLERGHCLILLDGLDEVADASKRKRVVAWVEEQMATYHECHFIISSRPGGYQSNPLSQVSTLEVQSFTREQQESFVQNWYLANELMAQQKDDIGVRQDAQDGAKDLLQRIFNSQALSQLAVNPLLLTLIASVHRYRSSLPGRRVELYAEICNVFLGRRREATGVEDDLTPAQKMRVLQPLAYIMMQKNTREIQLKDACQVIVSPLRSVSQRSEPSEFLKMIEDGSGLLLERENGVYSFAHLTFQEYLAAQHIQEKNLEGVLTMQVGESWWRETTRLYCAQNNATAIIASCIDAVSVPRLTLAMECLEEALEVHPDVRQALHFVLEDWVDTPSGTENWRMVAETLLTLRFNRMPLDEKLYVDEDFINHAEYQLFLEEMRTQGKYYQPDHWDNYQFSSGTGKHPIVGVRSSDAIAFCQWLTERDADELFEYRLPPSLEANPVLGHVGYWTHVGSSGILTLVRPGSPTFVDLVPLAEKYYNRDLARIRALDLARDLARRSPSPSDFYNPTLARNLDQVLNHARNRDPNLVVSLTRARDRAMVRARAFDIAHVLDFVSDFTRARDHTHTFTFVLAEVFNLDFDFALDIAYDLILNRARVRTRSRVIDRARQNILLVAGVYQWAFDRRESTLRGLWDYETFRTLAAARNAYLDLYLGLVIMEERCVGNLEAFESIRIARVRRTVDPSS